MIKLLRITMIQTMMEDLHGNSRKVRLKSRCKHTVQEILDKNQTTSTDHKTSGAMTHNIMEKDSWSLVATVVLD